MNIECVVIDTSNNNEIKNDRYFISEEAANSGPAVLGLAENLKVLIKYTPNVRPEVNRSFFSVQPAKTITTIAHPTYPEFDQYLIEWATPRKSQEEIDQAIDDSEQLALNQILTNSNDIKSLFQVVGVLAAKAEGLTLKPWEQRKLDRLVRVATKIRRNEVAAIQKKQAAVDGGTPDLTDYPEKDPEPEVQ